MKRQTKCTKKNTHDPSGQKEHILYKMYNIYSYHMSYLYMCIHSTYIKNGAGFFYFLKFPFYLKYIEGGGEAKNSCWNFKVNCTWTKLSGSSQKV